MKTWQENEYFVETWRHRIQKMASYIGKGDVVADLGCGKQWLREYLPSLAEYVPVDYRERSEDTLVCDFNRHEFPNMFVDVSFVSGALEYVNDVYWFARNVVNHTRAKIILSYCSTDVVPDFSQRKKNMWVNHYSSKDIQNIFAQSGFELEAMDEVGANVIFVMTRKHPKKACGVVIHEDAPGNLGDFTQALAAMEILGEAFHAVYLHRESLHLYRGRKLPVICNGWFSHAAVYPPNDRLVPLYISVHITPGARKWFSTDAMISHLRSHAPIGCRDTQTRDFLLGMEVNAYFSGCLTYALGSRLRERWSGINEKNAGTPQVYLVDPPVQFAKEVLPVLRALFFSLGHLSKIPKIWPLAIEQGSFLRCWLFAAFLAYEYRKIIRQYGGGLVFQTQYLTKDEQLNYDYLFGRIQDRLHGYYQGRAVVTGRIHAAIPALFSNANVVFIQPGKLATADVSRVSDHAKLFKQRVALNGVDFGADVIAVIDRDEREQGNREDLPSDLVKLQVQTIADAVKEFYANNYLH
jgi:hypothetical protein